MEEEQNQSQEYTVTPIPKTSLNEPKKPKLNPVMYVLVTMVLMVATGFGVYYYMNNQQEKTKQANLKNITDLQNVVKTLNKKVKTKPSSSAPTATDTNTGSSTQLSVHANSLKTFCQGNTPNILVQTMQYVENANGFYGLCGINIRDRGGAGYLLIAHYSNGKWSKVWEGNGMMEQSLCAEYKIPASIYPDCTGNY